MTLFFVASDPVNSFSPRQALDIFSDLVTSSIDYAEARNNDDSFTPGDQSKASPMLDISKLQKIKFVVERIKLSQT